jgi:hypothetical protein
MTRLDKLNECLQIARKHNNTYMEQNILIEIEKESSEPSAISYPDPTDD